MSNYEKLYWLTRLDSLHGGIETFFIVSFAVAIAALVFAPLFLMELENFSWQIVSKWVKRLVIVWVVFGLIKAFIPTQKEAILIIAGGSTIDYVQADSSLNKIPYQATQLISDYMDKQIKELEEKK